MTANVLACENCGGPVAWRAKRCRWCAAPLTWAGVPQLQRGQTLVDLDLKVEPLPNPTSTPTVEACPRGVRLELSPGGMCAGTADVELASCAVALSGVALDAGAAFGVLGRRASTGTIQCAYALNVRPGLRTWSLSALLWGGGRTAARPLRMPTFCEAIAPVGALNSVELRMADSLLEVHINDEAVDTIVDAVFAYGRPGWRALSFGTAPSTVELARFSVFRLHA